MIDKSRYSRKGKNRKIEEKSLRIYFLIVCEGEKTEPNYFEGMKAQLPPHVLSVINLDIKGTAKNTLSLIEDTIKIIMKSAISYDRVWAVFDKDSFPPQNFGNSINKAEANGIKCAWSNESFELWYALHFQKIEHAMPRDNYKKIIEQEFKRCGLNGFSYRKNADNMFELLEKYGDRKQARKRAKELIILHKDKTSYATMNPCTYVFELVDEIFEADMIFQKKE